MRITTATVSTTTLGEAAWVATLASRVYGPLTVRELALVEAARPGGAGWVAAAFSVIASDRVGAYDGTVLGAVSAMSGLPIARLNALGGLSN